MGLMQKKYLLSGYNTHSAIHAQGVPVSSCVHGAVQSASSNFSHCSTLIGHEPKIGLSADGAVNTAHISVACLMR